MDKWLKIFLISLSIVGFSFLGSRKACAGEQDLGLLVEQIKRDIKKQEGIIVSLKDRYDNILRQEEELKKFLEQQVRDIEQPQEEAKKVKFAEPKAEKQKSTAESEHIKLPSEHGQAPLPPGREVEVMFSLQGKGKTNRSIEELDALIKKQKDLFEVGSKLETEILEEQGKIKALEEKSGLGEKGQEGLR